MSEKAIFINREGLGTSTFSLPQRIKQQSDRRHIRIYALISYSFSFQLIAVAQTNSAIAATSQRPRLLRFGAVILRQ